MNDTTAGTPSEDSRPSQGARELTWPEYIGWGWMIVQARMEADWTGLWDYALPHVHATEETVTNTEAQLGFRLPESYRGFLLTSNGWPCFYQDMTIFSTSDLLGGDLHKAGQIQLELPECVEAMAAGGVIAADHFPVAASLTQIDVALMGKPGTPAEGTVSWVRGEVIERYDDFLDYYLSMMEYNKLDTADIREKDAPKPDGVPHAVIDHPGSPPVLEEARRDDL
ncbi:MULTISPECIES: SMI1/KNR4 family protein [Actinomyces]|uniref:SMI1/KNR4 family protein n=1 Tax=Actinomyces TaxID=1654 RepID=UPI00094D4085|nr:SMI1/KNR4 family protein [Actinomyces oris]OLO57969.1 SMI1/KNR4 family protein [Actinomyces oris]OLO61624.1 SMI1/KNR4 family protein [Actinomyces oris]